MAVSEALGPELLANGDFSLSTGIGATSSIGPGWTSSYIPCGPNIFAAPCTSQRFSYFTTNAGQVTGGNGNANPIPALGGRSMAVNVGPNTAVPILEWANIYLENGKEYRFQMSAAVIFNPFSVAMKIAGGAQGTFPMPAALQSQWSTVLVEFVFSGPSGYYPVGLFSNSGVAAGNDHTFDNFSLRTFAEVDTQTCCDADLAPRSYQGGGTAVAMICNGQVVWFDSDTGEPVDPGLLI